MYTIKIHTDSVRALCFVRALREKLAGSRFSADIRAPELRETKRSRAGWQIELATVRLRAPGKRYLEWADWIEFNDLVNDLLDDQGALACVWSLADGKFWIRRGAEGRRLRYDPGNRGTPDQFIAAAAAE